MERQNQEQRQGLRKSGGGNCLLDRTVCLFDLSLSAATSGGTFFGVPFRQLRARHLDPAGSFCLMSEKFPIISVMTIMQIAPYIMHARPF
jgi:hypothetical protein